MNHNTTIDTPHKELLRTIEVRLISRPEQTRWDTLIRQNHYLGFRSFVGESIRYVAESHGHWMELFRLFKGFCQIIPWLCLAQSTKDGLCSCSSSTGNFRFWQFLPVPSCAMPGALPLLQNGHNAVHKTCRLQ